MKRICVVLCVAMAALTGCDTARVDRLEKENAALKAKVDKADVARNFDLQEKCAKDANAWFVENWVRVKDASELCPDAEYTNHYSKKLNGCFSIVRCDFHLKNGKSSGYGESLWNIYENNRLGGIGRDAYSPATHENHIYACELKETECTTEQEWDKLKEPYTNE